VTASTDAAQFEPGVRGGPDEALLWVDRLPARLKAGGNGAQASDHFFLCHQCFLSVIQTFLAFVQFRFALRKLCFSYRIVFLAAANHRKGDERRKDNYLFHVRSEV